MTTENVQSTAKGMSLHIGLNKFDPASYPLVADDPTSGWDGLLIACESDAHDMQNIADSQGYKSKLLIGGDATEKNVSKELKKAAESLSSGDSFFLTFSGHGGQVPDWSGDEEDGFDETWCLFDRMFIDDELAMAYAQFEAGVNIYVLSDSCHSGTAIRSGDATAPPRKPPTLTKEENVAIFGVEKPTFRVLRREISLEVFMARESFYEGIIDKLEPVEEQDIKANIRLISACQDEEEAADGEENGKFTGVVKQIWAGGDFDGGFMEFHAAIKKNLKADYAEALRGKSTEEIEKLNIQVPNYASLGPDEAEIDTRKPFSI